MRESILRGTQQAGGIAPSAVVAVAVASVLGCSAPSHDSSAIRPARKVEVHCKKKRKERSSLMGESSENFRKVEH